MDEMDVHMTLDRDAAIAALEQLQFNLAGSVALPSGNAVPKFQLESAFSRKGTSGKALGWVYVWTKFKSDALVDICYVGKAGKTLRERCDQHVGGFKGSTKKGILNGQQIRQFLSESADHALRVYARKSPNERILEEESVSMCEAEERAMITKMRRLGAGLWNS
jgi:hypothetical protein